MDNLNANYKEKIGLLLIYTLILSRSDCFVSIPVGVTNVSRVLIHTKRLVSKMRLFPVDFVSEALDGLKINVESSFSNFERIVNDNDIFQNPFNVDIDTLAPELRMRMND